MFRITADGVTIFSDTDEDARLRLITNPQASAEIGRSGGLTFTMLPTHPSYNSIHKFKTRIEAYMGTRLIFQGRIIEDEQDIYNTKSITCEGALSYLLDSVQAPRPGNISVRHFLTSCLAEHNQQVEEEKRFFIGEVTVLESEETINRNISQYTTTKSAIEEFLTNIYGGYIVVRRGETGLNYVDYLKEYPTTESPQEVRLRNNIIDLKQKEVTANIFTKLIPVGKYPNDWVGEVPNNRIMTIGSVNSGVDHIVHSAGLLKYGSIVRVENFDNPKSPTELLAAGNAFMSRYMDPKPTSLTIKAVDLHLTNIDIEQFILGNKYNIISEPNGVDVTLTLSSMKWDFENPENMELVFDTPIQDLGEKTLKGVFRNLGGGNSSDSGVARFYKFISETHDTLRMIAPKIDIITDNLDIMADKILIQSEHILISSEAVTELGTSINSALEATKDGVSLSISEINGELELLSSSINVVKDQITQEVIDRTQGDSTLSGKIQIQAGQVTQSIQELVGEVAVVEGLIRTTQNLITTEVIDRRDSDKVLQSLITVQSDLITQSVSVLQGDIKILEGSIIQEQQRIALEATNRETAGSVLSGKITIEANKIKAAIVTRKNDFAILASDITVTEQQVALAVSNRENQNIDLDGKITVEAGKITSEVNTRTTQGNTLEGKITQTESAISLEVTNRQDGQNELAGRIGIVENGINLSVRKDGIITAINASDEGVKILASKLDLDGIIMAGDLAVAGSIQSVLASFESLVSSGTVDILRTLNADASGNTSTAGHLTAGTIVATGAMTAPSTYGTTIHADEIYLSSISIELFLNNKVGVSETVESTARLDGKTEQAYGKASELSLIHRIIGDLTARVNSIYAKIDEIPDKAIGYTGSLGPPGFKGSKGDSGAPGPVGDPGIPGHPGNIGPYGLSGDKGQTGDPGILGAVGATGYQGSEGQKGYLGSEGPRGVSGYRGSLGAPSLLNGILGEQGDPGVQGAKGPDGAVGQTGVMGELGARGAQGAVGATGYQGSQGVQGDPGDRGYTGSVGAPGDRGYTGSKGAKGETGDQGDTGYPGPTGLRGFGGSRGYTGSRGTSGVG